MAKPKLYMSAAWLIAEFQNKHRTIEDIAKQCGVSTNTIRTQLKKAGLIK